MHRIDVKILDQRLHDSPPHYATPGSAGLDLRACIDDELSGLAEPLGLEVRNVAVPQISISPEVQAGLDAIVQSRLSTEKAKQDVEKKTEGNDAPGGKLFQKGCQRHRLKISVKI